MNYSLSLLKIILPTSSLFLSFILCTSPEIIRPSPSGPFLEGVDTNAFFFWYSLPTDYKKRFVENVKKLSTGPEPATIITPPDHTTTYESEHFENIMFSNPNWVEDLMDYYDEKSAICDFRSRIRLVYQVLKMGSVEEIDKLFNVAPKMMSSVLNDPINHKILVLLVTNSLREGPEIIEILKRLERIGDISISDFIDMIRNEAIKHDDLDLLKFTDEYSELIIPSVYDQGRLIQIIKPNLIPTNVWTYICSESDVKSEIHVKIEDDFMKFNLFSEPVNTKNWTLVMLALATQNYDLAKALPVQLNRTSSEKVIPFVSGNHITRLEHLIPLIPNPMTRSFFVDKYALPESLKAQFVSSFTTLDKDGNQITVTVSGARPPNCTSESTRINIDIDKVTSRSIENRNDHFRANYDELINFLK